MLMLKQFSISFIVSAFIIIATKLYFIPGFVLINWENHTVETTITFLIISLVIITSMLLIILNSTRALYNILTYSKKWWKKKVTQKADHDLSVAVAYSFFNDLKVENIASKTLGKTKNNAINYLLLARYSNLKNISNYLSKTKLEKTIQNEILLGILYAKEEFQHGIRLMQTPSFSTLKHKWWCKFIVKSKSYDLVIENFKANQWYKYEGFVIEAFKQSIMQKENYQEIYDDLDKTFKNEPLIFIEYIQRLRKEHLFNEANALIQTWLKNDYDENVARLIHSSSCELAFLLKIIKKHGSKTPLLNALANKYIDLNENTKAMDIFNQMAEISPSPLIYYKLGKLYQIEDMQDNANHAFSMGLKLTLGKDLIP